MPSVIASLIATLQLLIASIGPSVTIERAWLPVEPAGPVVGRTFCVAPRSDGSALWCPDRVWRVQVLPTVHFSFDTGRTRSPLSANEQAAALNTLVHELAHAYDGMDDGRLNGSPGHPRPPTFEEARELTGVRGAWEAPDWYCWGAETDPLGRPLNLSDELRHAEWYACEVARTGELG
ncbi:MAG: hypothetical protein O2822_04945 [Chloroflexi bacterium]|nr:hypothetical protein [Chloroflexota bacterium]